MEKVPEENLILGLFVLCVFRTKSNKVQDTQDGENTTVECLSDTLSCATVWLDPDSAATPGTDVSKEIQLVTTSGMKYISAYSTYINFYFY